MRRRRKKIDIYIVIVLAVLTAGFFIYDHISSEGRGVQAYTTALANYKEADFEKAYQAFGQVPSGSC